MAKKLDNSVLNTLVTDFDKQYSLAETTLYEVYKTLSVLTKSLNFRGTAAEAQKTFIQQTSMNYGYVLLDITKSLKDYVHLAKDGFLEFESEPSGKVNQQTISDNRASLSDIAKQIVELSGKLSLPERNARQEGASIASTGASDLGNLFLAIDKGLEKVNSDFDLKDSDLKVKSEAILDSIQELQDNFSNITTSYIKKSGKYDSRKISQLTNESWYLKGNPAIFSNKQKEDPYYYHTGHYSWLEGQFAYGLAKDFYTAGEGAVVAGKSEYGIEDGEIYLKSHGMILGGKFEGQATSAVKVNASANLASGNIDLRYGKNGKYGSASIGGPSIQGKAEVIDGLFSVTGQARAAYAEGTAGIYDNGDEFYYGFDGSAAWAEASVQFDLFNIEVPDMDKPLLAMSVRPKGKAGVDAALSVSGGSIYEDLFGLEWLDVDSMSIKIGGALGIGGDVSITIPVFDLNF